MKIVALNGSPKKDGNTFQLLKHATDFLEKTYGAETQILQINTIMQKQKIPYCVACTSPCTAVCYKGTELEDAYNIIAEADGILIGSPVYFGTVSAQLKAFWDKSRAVRSQKRFLNLVGGVLTVGAARYGGQETTMKAIFDMMLIQGMVIVGDGQEAYDCGHQGVAAQRFEEKDEVAFKRAEVLAARIYEVAKALKPLRKG